MANELPNILVIMSDEHGAKFSGTYGHPIVETPSMDRLAAQGTRLKTGTRFSPAQCQIVRSQIESNIRWRSNREIDYSTTKQSISALGSTVTNRLISSPRRVASSSLDSSEPATPPDSKSNSSITRSTLLEYASIRSTSIEL